MNRSVSIILIVMLTLISTWFVVTHVIVPYADIRIEFANAILRGEIDTHYRYRLLKPLLGNALESLLSLFGLQQPRLHIVSYGLWSFGIFAGIFSFFYLYLKKFFSTGTVFLGLVLLQAVIPLSVTGHYMEGDFITLLFHIVGFLLFLSGRDNYLPLLVAIGTINREQIIFLVLFYAIHLLSREEKRKRGLYVLFGSAFAWLAVMLGLRWIRGFEPSIYTVSTNIAENLDLRNLLTLITPLWAAEVGAFALLGALAFRKSSLFFRLSFLGLAVYTGAFFLKGYMWELAKFLPAYVILIPMGLQSLSGEYTGQADQGSQRGA